MSRGNSNNKSKRRTKKRNSSKGRTKSKTISLRFKERIFGIIIMSSLLTILGIMYRPFVLNWIFSFQCVELGSEDIGIRPIYDAINLNHQLSENKNKKDELLRLLNDKVIWFKKKRLKRKEDISFFSRYDEFCFASKPIYDEKDDLDRNYQVRFMGMHKYRKLGKSLVEIENYYAEIINGRISKIYPVTISDLDKEALGLSNFVYRYYYLAIFLFWLVLLGLATYVVSLPEYVINFFRSLLNKLGI